MNKRLDEQKKRTYYDSVMSMSADELCHVLACPYNDCEGGGSCSQCTKEFLLSEVDPNNTRLAHPFRNRR